MWLILWTVGCKKDEDAFELHGYGSGSGSWDTGQQSPDPEDPEDTAATPCEPDDAQLLWVSADDSNSMSSATQIRAGVIGGSLNLGQVQIREHELMNYYDFGYAHPAAGSLALDVELVRDDDRFRLQTAVTSPTVTARTGPP